MNASIINFDYKGNQIPFERGKDVMVNLTAMAKPYPNKNLSTIINSLEIREYVNALTEIKNFSSADLLIVRKGGDISQQGTWGHRLVAIRVAQKLNPALAVWVDMKIEELLRTGVTTVSNDDEAIAYAMQVLNKRLEVAKAEKECLLAENANQSETINLLTNEVKQSAPKVKCYDEYISSDGTYTTTQIAKEYDWSAETLNKKLKEMGIQYKVGQTWVLTSKYQNMGYTDTQTYTETIDDETRSYVSTVWTQKGREFIHSLFHSNKESTLFSEVSELKNAIREEDDLKTRIESLGKPILNDMKQIPLLLDKYKMMIAKDKLSVYERKVFLFVVVSLFDPKALAGKKMKHGLREVIGSSLGFENKSTISDNMNDISSYYTRTPKFRKDTKRAFMCIGGYQAN